MHLQLSKLETCAILSRYCQVFWVHILFTTWNRTVECNRRDSHAISMTFSKTEMDHVQLIDIDIDRQTTVHRRQVTTFKKMEEIVRLMPQSFIAI